MLKDTARKQYLANDLNCAEAVLHGADEEYSYHLPDVCFRQIGAFGGGCAIGSLCGAIAGAVAVLGQELIETKAHETPSLSEVVGDFMSMFHGRHGSFLCSDLKPVSFEEKNRCASIVESSAEMLELTLKKYGLRE